MTSLARKAKRTDEAELMLAVLRIVGDGGTSQQVLSTALFAKKALSYRALRIEQAKRFVESLVCYMESAERWNRGRHD